MSIIEIAVQRGYLQGLNKMLDIAQDIIDQNPDIKPEEMRRKMVDFGFNEGCAFLKHPVIRSEFKRSDQA